MNAILSRCSSDDGVRGASAALNSRVDDDGADIIRGGVEALFLCYNLLLACIVMDPIYGTHGFAGRQVNSNGTRRSASMTSLI